ncbi:MAG: hypothetical protein B7X35_02405 [Halothiobacillus sp. 14-56-357]|jgi:hypothetical protein|uniref:DUF1134 domain-containing protein n=1 Tax=Halothiobacillus sp. 15-55-196 TaxID=1970382 RepID=UPI000BC9C18A|nr:DUF1134 domain-containing protein [Halothiobacillus sp. 15-55-196]OZB37600.1 MAG: hypothetical protein B7X44_01315 [Halothiobacillus sp. 15-55-196]OZB57152.1 MAG: hypothetical protein B7X35_02405 [Halothiobacillus sp. 14-56-357]OZB78164.1 MAG: hypothetical protein B7X29_05955 [Halothiobacillus sp. 13-55-115]
MHLIKNHLFKSMIIGVSLALTTGTLSGCANNPSASNTTGGVQTDTATNDSNSYNEYETTNEAVNFLGGSAEAIAKLMDKAFADYGRPNAYIKGEEAGAAIVLGVRYGKGELVTKSGQRTTVYWQGPSVGWDFGGDAGKVFILVYNLPQTDLIFQRFAGVNGSLYFVGGLGMDYLRSQNIVVAPIRVGVGIRLGASVGYMQFTRDKSYNPF